MRDCDNIQGRTTMPDDNVNYEITGTNVSHLMTSYDQVYTNKPGYFNVSTPITNLVSKDGNAQHPVPKRAIGTANNGDNAHQFVMMS